MNKNSRDEITPKPLPIHEITGHIGDHASVWAHFNQVLAGIESQPASAERDALFVSTCLELAKLSFIVGKGFDSLVQFLKSALKASGRLGDKRSTAMLNLHLGRLYYFGEQRNQAMDVFAKGKAEVESLGDEDISANAAELIGLYLFIQGRYPDAMPYFETAARHFEFGEQGHSGTMWLSYCAAFMGRYHQAIGTLDFFRRLAIERGDRALAATLRAVLGMFLTRIKRSREAIFHLSGALREAKETQNILASYFAMGGLAFHHMTTGHLEESRKWLSHAVAEGAKAGLIRQYASPFVLEILFEFHRNELDVIPDMTFKDECRRLLKEPNIHMRGVVLRLMSLNAMAGGTVPDRNIEADLKQSEKLLLQSGDPIQLGKTYIAITRLKLSRNNPAGARQSARKAWKNFSGYSDVFYPDDLRHLLTGSEDYTPEFTAREELTDMFSTLIKDLIPSDKPDELLQQMVIVTNRFFSAERGGIFWFRDYRSKKAPKLRAACNLFQSDINDEDFRSSMTLIFDAHRKNQPQIVRQLSDLSFPGRVRAMMAIPFQSENRVRGVLYHDNSYVNDCFTRFTTEQLNRMGQSLSQYVDQTLKFTKKLEQRAKGQLGHIEIHDQSEIFGQSPALKKILDQTNRIANTDSSVLLLGETGTGKELLAKHVHNRSPRGGHPLVVVDPTAIPEMLVESELFGHEKGAFTGADRQKPGRIELADKGTLFIDEVGEIPLSMQAKLLRAIQEKTMVRVGGNKTHTSDFRLIAATNRDLAKEVEAGRFREDLFYRLNVIPLTLPPLRDRGDDIVLLARLFIEKFCGKFNRPLLQLTPETEIELKAYNWPGNVRELKNTIERSVLLTSTEDTIELNLPATQKHSTAGHPFADFPSLDEVQRRYILYALEKCNGKIAGEEGAAAMLGMKRTSLYKRMTKLGLR